MRITLIAVVLVMIGASEASSILDHLRYYQRDARSANIDYHPIVGRHPAFQVAKPIGFIAGEPIWPRAYEGTEDSSELQFDDNGAAYRVPRRDSFSAIYRRSYFAKHSLPSATR